MSPLRSLLTGQWGNVGFELQRRLAPLGEAQSVDQDECGLSGLDALRELGRTVHPTMIIVHPAACTALDRAEEDSEQGSNLEKTMLKAAAQRDELRVSAAQHGAPTTTDLLTHIMEHLVNRMLRVKSIENCFGMCLVTRAGSTTWHVHMQHVLRYASRAGCVLRVVADAVHLNPTREYPTPADGPLNSRVDSSRLQRTFDDCLPTGHRPLTISRVYA